MSGVPQRFWGTPIRYLQWAMHEKPAIFWSCVLGGMGPMCFVVVPPLRRWAGDEDPAQIPLTYPGEFSSMPPMHYKLDECPFLLHL
ncbi:n19m, NADH-ubiquinone oxidoreductase 9.5 kDa subunit [Exophiala xenobiotica]|nr:n19m, NADH-ubiquinone oxidoreductase 9.5 kDa subunit [Exophiala xenobiotica]